MTTRLQIISRSFASLRMTSHSPITMRRTLLSASLVTAIASPTLAQRGAPPDTGLAEIKTIVAHLDLERYKATIKGLTQFGDRRQGTDRNRAAVDWIEAQLKSYGCTNTERIKYEYNGRQLRNDSTNRVDSIAQRGESRGGSRRSWWRRW